MRYGFLIAKNNKDAKVRIMLKGLIIAALIAAPTASLAGSIIGQASVGDGDTFTILNVKVRLHGVDAPESDQPCYRDDKAWQCGRQAAFALDQHLDGRHLKCWPVGQSYDRVVAQCWIVETDEDVAEWMARNGWAVAAPKYSKRYLPAEAKAKADKAGIWDSEFVMPWIWRNQQKSGL